MGKSFNDFVNRMDAINWSEVSQEIEKQLDFSEERILLKDFAERIVHCDSIVSTTILKEYHEWLNNQDEK